MRKLKRLSLYLLGLVILTGVVAGAWKLRQRRVQEAAGVDPPEPAPWALRVARVSLTTVESGFPVLAQVDAVREITICPQISGVIQEMGPREGVAVKKNTLLAKLDTRELEESRKSLQEKLEIAKAEQDRAEEELRREQEMIRKGASSERALVSRKTAALTTLYTVRSTERQLRELDVHIGYGRITAPSDGSLSARLAEPGDLAQAGHPIYKMTVEKGARLRLRVPESILEEVQIGTPVVVTYGNENLPLRVHRVFPAVDERAMGTAECDLAEIPFSLPSGARVAARLILHRKESALKVPRDSLVAGLEPESLQVFKVLRAPDGSTRVKAVPVKVDLLGTHGVAVSGDLADGDEVVVGHENVLLKLRDGDPIVAEGRGRP